MTKHIQAFFKSEDEAEGARISLLSSAIDMEQMEVGELDHQPGATGPLFAPWFAAGGGSMNTGVTNGGFVVPFTLTAQGPVPLVSVGYSDIGDSVVSGDGDDEDREPEEIDPSTDGIDNDFIGMNYVLSVKTKDEDYDTIVSKLRSLGAYVKS